MLSSGVRFIDSSKNISEMKDILSASRDNKLASAGVIILGKQK